MLSTVAASAGLGRDPPRYAVEIAMGVALRGPVLSSTSGSSLPDVEAGKFDPRETARALSEALDATPDDTTIHFGKLLKRVVAGGSAQPVRVVVEKAKSKGIFEKLMGKVDFVNTLKDVLNKSESGRVYFLTDSALPSSSGAWSPAAGDPCLNRQLCSWFDWCAVVLAPFTRAVRISLFQDQELCCGCSRAERGRFFLRAVWEKNSVGAGLR